MIDLLPQFLQEAKKGMADKVLRQQVDDFVNQYQDSFQKSVKQFSNLELAKLRAARLRWTTINHLDKYLIEFESNFIKAGGKVVWAKDMHDVTAGVHKILKRHNAKTLLCDKNMHTEEHSWIESLKADFLEIIDVNKGQLTNKQVSGPANDRPHGSSFNENIYIRDTGKSDASGDIKNKKAITSSMQQLRKELLRAEAGVTTAQFFIANPGAIVIGDNEGASLFTSCIPRISIVLAPLDRIVPSVAELDTLLSLYSTYRNGARQSTFNTILTGPRLAEEKEGPRELYIILIDNGRSNILSHEPQRKILSCIDCRACLPASAIYKTVGGRSYPGPAKAVSVPLAFGPEKYKYLADLATMDGSGSEACPVKINFPRLTLENRKLFVQQGYGSRYEKWYYFVWKKTMLKRDFIGWAGIEARKLLIASYYKKSSEGLRSWPKSPAKSFNQQWRDKMKYK